MQTHTVTRSSIGRWFPWMSLALLSWTSFASAVTAWRCNACTQAQYDALAQSKARTARDYVYIYDFPNDHFRKYLIGREPKLDGGYDSFAFPGVPAISEQQWFETARETWALNGQNVNSLQSRATVSIDDMSSVPVRTRNADAYGIVAAGAHQVDLMTCMASNCYGAASDSKSTVNGNIAKLLDAAAGIEFSDHPVSLGVTVTLHNGSQVIFEWAPPASQPLLTFARDANHNAIPLQASQLTDPSPPYGSVFTFDRYHTDLDGFVQLARSYGVPVVNMGKGLTVACTTTPHGRQCEVRPNE